MAEEDVIAEVIALMDEGVLVERSETLLRPVVTLVASKSNTERVDDAGRFVEELKERYPYAKVVVGDTSPVERAAAVTAGLLRMPFEVIQKADKGEWDEGAGIRDERVVAKATHVVAMDGTARSKNYKQLATQQRKQFHQV